MRRLLLLLVASLPCVAQSAVPEAPKPQTPRNSIAVSAALASRYSWTRSAWDMTVSGGVRYRLPDSPISVGLLYSHAALSGENLTFFDLNYRLYEYKFR